MKESDQIANLTIAQYNTLDTVKYLRLELLKFQDVLLRASLEIERSQETLDKSIAIKRDREKKLREMKAKKRRARDEKK